MQDEDDNTMLDDTLEIFEAMLDSDGIVATIVADGVIVGFSAAKLVELLADAQSNEDKRVIIFVSDGGELDVVEEDPEFKN